MIRDPDNQEFMAGSIRPGLFHETTSFSEQIEGYLDDRLWNNGISLTLIGPPGCGKTSLGLSIHKAAWLRENHTLVYWNESDFLADVRYLWRLEDMTGKLPRDDALWVEYIDWEKSMWDRKERQHLFLDDACRSYTPMQWYETENLLRYREAKGLATMVAVSTKLWEHAPDEIKSVMERQNYVIKLEARGDGRG